MLHPNFSLLFRWLRQADNPLSLEWEYEVHIEKFSNFTKNLPDRKPEMELIGETLMKMWQYGREIADPFDQIKTLKGLIPICANCKKVRNDEGF